MPAMSEQKDSRCRFRLSNIDENLVRHETGYDVFEPTVSLEVNGKNVFEALGISGVENPVIMTSLEMFLKETLRLVERVTDEPTSEHRYWFLGTGFGLKLRRDATNLALFLEVDGRWGPTQGLPNQQSKEAGKVAPKDWVQAVVELAGDLLDIFKQLNPRIYSTIRMDLPIQQLTEWLAASRK